MKSKLLGIIMFLCLFLGKENFAQKQKAVNPIIYADVPDLSMIRVGNTYYMSSTTMHMSPGLPIMSSKDLVNWQLESYCYDRLVENDAMNLNNGQNTYGRGSWASCIRYHNGEFMVSTFAATSGKTHIFTSKNSKGSWHEKSFKPAYHDHTIFFDDDGKVYMIYGAGKLKILELKSDLSGPVEGIDEKFLIENASAPAGTNIMLGAEGSQLFKKDGKYYLFNICWPRGGMRTVIIHRADKITGPWEGKVALQDLGVAQGGLIDTPDGRWFAYLFRDNGGVGRIPYLVPVEWKNGWPTLGENGKVPMSLNLPANKSLIPNLVNSDEFSRKKEESKLPLVWQWNHNPDNSLWSVLERKGFLRLKTGRIDTNFTQARNTLTQRTFGPTCSGSIMLDVGNMKDGDYAGLSVLQKHFGQIGVKIENGKKTILMVSANAGKPVEIQKIPLEQNKVYFKIECDFTDRKDLATFFYSLDGKKWTNIGETLKMPYTIPHFMGYRFGLFNYATKNVGGFADFDYFRVSDKISTKP
ncbi:glycoside hydrolase 43 family protein [Emticicia sp.]|uniref:glycoside hydrolase family 43 protein n=1 Tax=Emticicia sp. TaxID=1930953 RepID=UPI0037501775